MVPVLGSTLAMAAVLGGGLALRPDLLAQLSAPAEATAHSAPTRTVANGAPGPAADRATVIAGTNPVTGASSHGVGYTLDRSILGLPVVPHAPSAQLPELHLRPPGPGRTGAITTETRNRQFGRTATWTAKPQIDGPERRIVQTVAENGYLVVPTEPGELHLLCDDRRGPGSYYVDSREGEWRVHRVDGGPNYDVRYRFVQYDRSPLAARTPCS